MTEFIGYIKTLALALGFICVDVGYGFCDEVKTTKCVMQVVYVLILSPHLEFILNLTKIGLAVKV